MYYKQTDRKIVQNDFDRKDEGKMVEKMPLCPEERALSYCKYFDLPMEEPDPRSMQIWNAGPVPEETVLRIENINDLFKPGYLPCEQGYCALSDGTGFVANYVRMEGVTAEMGDWWFTWHFIKPPSVPEGNGRQTKNAARTPASTTGCVAKEQWIFWKRRSVWAVLAFIWNPILLPIWRTWARTTIW